MKSLLTKLPAMIVIVVMMIAGPYAMSSFAAQPDEMATSVKNLNDAILEAMKKGKEAGFSGRFHIFEPVVNDNFAITTIAPKTVGKNWDSFSEEQKQLFTKTYQKWSTANYAGSFDSYDNETFEVQTDSIQTKGNAVLITSLMKRPNKKAIEFLYVLQEFNGKWLIVDIHTSGVSQLALTRSQFVDLLKDKGFDGLIASMNDKVESFAQNKK
ncbi:MAG: ABC transporter substrate-binding protein [Candidatus Magnetoovum sp. WYHC-5]|nr:ABC transporter substrate-binding protein [Candidatus Magnetoovum sp. WYHC-5]